jgi:hypothetical protein
MMTMVMIMVPMVWAIIWMMAVRMASAAATTTTTATGRTTMGRGGCASDTISSSISGRRLVRQMQRVRPELLAVVAVAVAALTCRPRFLRRPPPMVTATAVAATVAVAVRTRMEMPMADSVAV